jgi:flagellar hook-length control protein FliK
VATDALPVDHSAVEATIGAQLAEHTEKTEPTSGAKRGRGAKAAVTSDPASAPAETAALSLETSAAAADTGEAAAAAQIVAAIDSSAENESQKDEAANSDGKENAELRPGGFSTTLATRQEKLHESEPRSAGLTEAERVRFVQRVARAFHSMGDEGGEVRLRLSPPELGSLRVEVSVRDGVLSARLEAETTSARNLLLDNLPALRERLAEQNIKVERFDVDVRDEQRHTTGEHFAGQADAHRQGQRERPREHQVKRPDTNPLGAPRGASRADNTGELNIVI